MARQPAGQTEARVVAPERFVGIDVAKGWLAGAERPSGATWRVANDAEGWDQVVARCTATGDGGRRCRPWWWSRRPDATSWGW